MELMIHSLQLSVDPHTPSQQPITSSSSWTAHFRSRVTMNLILTVEALLHSMKLLCQEWTFMVSTLVSWPYLMILHHSLIMTREHLPLRKIMLHSRWSLTILPLIHQITWWSLLMVSSKNLELHINSTDRLLNFLRHQEQVPLLKYTSTLDLLMISYLKILSTQSILEIELMYWVKVKIDFLLLFLVHPLSIPTNILD